MPVGFKNRTDGDVQVAVDAILSARHPHSFPSLTHEGAPAVLTTSGNEHGHLVLRGGSRSGPNFDAEHVAQAAALLQEAGAPKAILVDCSHANSAKRFERQPEVAHDVAQQIAAGQRAIIGVMLESHLVAGAQAVVPGQPLVYGQSITDGCLAFEQVVPVHAGSRGWHTVANRPQVPLNFCTQISLAPQVAHTGSARLASMAWAGASMAWAGASIGRVGDSLSPQAAMASSVVANVRAIIDGLVIGA